MTTAARVQLAAESVVDGVLRTLAAGRGRVRDPARTLKPWFVIVGAQRSGTTSLYSYLTRHPQVRGALVKEVHYFDLNYERGDRWYWGHFPRWRTATVTGEASPFYLLHPHAPERLIRALPDARIIVMLRDPVERACSHHRHEVAKGFEDLPLERALAAEDGRVAADLERMCDDPGFVSFPVQHFSYLHRGHYLEQLLRWERHVSRDRVLVVNADEFFHDPQAGYQRVLGFLGLREHRLRRYDQRNTYRRAPIAAETRRWLVHYFADHNARLYEHLGRDLGWARP